MFERLPLNVSHGVIAPKQLDVSSALDIAADHWPVRVKGRSPSHSAVMLLTKPMSYTNGWESTFTNYANACLTISLKSIVRVAEAGGNGTRPSPTNRTASPLNNGGAALLICLSTNRRTVEAVCTLAYLIRKLNTALLTEPGS